MSAKTSSKRSWVSCLLLAKAQQAIDLVSERGGLVVVPSGPGLRTLADRFGLSRGPAWRSFKPPPTADSWCCCGISLYRPRSPNFPGLSYLRTLLLQSDFRLPSNTLWVLPSRDSAERTVRWLREQGIAVPPRTFMSLRTTMAAFKSALVQLVECCRPRHLVLAIGSGVQEPLGFYLKRRNRLSP